jgi:hypothetical protein
VRAAHVVPADPDHPLRALTVGDVPEPDPVGGGVVVLGNGAFDRLASPAAFGKVVIDMTS